MVFQLVRDPDEFMDRKVGQPNLRWEILLVLLVGGFGVAGRGYVAYQISNAMAGIETVTYPLVGYAITPLVTVFVAWFAYSIGVHFISNRFFRARGSIKRIFKLTAWALVPLGVAYALRSAILIFIARGMDFEQVADNVEGGGFQGGVPQIVAEVESDPLFVVGLVLTAVGVVATGYLMIYIVRATKGLEFDEALRVAGIVAGAHLLYVVWAVANTI